MGRYGLDWTGSRYWQVAGACESFQRLKKARVHSYGTHWKVWTHNSRVWAHLINQDFCHRFSIWAVSHHPLSKADKTTFVLEELNVRSHTDIMTELWPPACWEQAITMTPHEPLLVCGGSVEGVHTTTTGFTMWLCSGTECSPMASDLQTSEVMWLSSSATQHFS